MIRALVIVISVVFFVDATTADDKSESKPLRFIQAVEIPLDAKQEGIQIGGLSSLYYDHELGLLAAITDDKGRLGGPVIHLFKLALSADELTIEPAGLTRLGDADGTALFPDEIIDAEAFDKLANGHWLVSSEGIDVENYFSLPMLYEFTQDGKLVRRIEVPTKFLPKQADLPNHGIRPNDAFESLSITPDDEHIYLVNEKALIQDGGVSEPLQTSVTRIVHKQRTAEGYEYVAEYPYILSALPNPDDADEVAGVLSISDIIAVAENQLLVVEKSFLTKPSIRNTVRLYLTHINENTSNVQDIAALEGVAYVATEKQLWADLDDYTDSDNFPKLDNVEGMIVGPTLTNGHQTLLFITDNNFSGRQKTLIYAFEIIKPL